MILEKAYYQQNFQVGAFLFNHYGLGAFIEEGETHQEVYAQLKERVHAQFMADNPHLQSAPQPQESEVLPVRQVQNWEYSAHTMFENIQACQDWDELKSFELLVKNKDEWKQAFDNRKKELNIIG